MTDAEFVVSHEKFLGLFKLSPDDKASAAVIAVSMVHALWDHSPLLIKSTNRTELAAASVALAMHMIDTAIKDSTTNEYPSEHPE